MLQHIEIHKSNTKELSSVWNQSKKERQFELSHQDIPGVTSLGRFEQSRLNHPIPFLKERSLKMLMLKSKLTSTSNVNLPTLY